MYTVYDFSIILRFNSFLAQLILWFYRFYFSKFSDSVHHYISHGWSTFVLSGNGCRAVLVSRSNFCLERSASFQR